MDLSKDVAKSNFRSNISVRKRRGKIGQVLFFSSMIIAMVALASLLYNVGIESFGLVAVQYENNPATLADRPLEALSKEELIVILQDNVSKGLFRRFNNDMPFEERTSESVLALIQERVVAEEVLASYPLNDVLFRRDQIEEEVSKKYPDATLRWKSWLSIDFLTTPMSSTAWLAGVRTAILGSLWMISITMVIAVPIGIGAAIYLEEYANDNFINRVIQSNINNLAGVPSIIYGMLGLAIFVRGLEQLTSGALFGVEGTNGRTVLSASLTMALFMELILILFKFAVRLVWFFRSQTHFPNPFMKMSLGVPESMAIRAIWMSWLSVLCVKRRYGMRSKIISRKVVWL